MIKSRLAATYAGAWSRRVSFAPALNSPLSRTAAAADRMALSVVRRAILGFVSAPDLAGGFAGALSRAKMVSRSVAAVDNLLVFTAIFTLGTSSFVAVTGGVTGMLSVSEFVPVTVTGDTRRLDDSRKRLTLAKLVMFIENVY